MHFYIPQSTRNHGGLKIITITCIECGVFFWMLKPVSLSMSVCLSAERRLHPDCILLDVYRVNPHCDWLIKPWKYSLCLSNPFFYLEINVNNKQWHEMCCVWGLCWCGCISSCWSRIVPAIRLLNKPTMCWGGWRLNWIWLDFCSIK